MTIVLFRSIRLCCFLMIGLSLVLLPHWVSAQDCHSSYQPVKAKMLQISELLSATQTKEDYLAHVKQRYEAVEVLMFMTGACAANQSLSLDQRRRWRELSTVLSSFQNMAKSSAFTDFEDWVRAKDADIQAVKVAKDVW